MVANYQKSKYFNCKLKTYDFNTNFPGYYLLRYKMQ